MMTKATIDGELMEDIRANERRLMMLYLSTLSRGEDTTKRLNELNAYRDFLAEAGIEPLSFDSSEFRCLYSCFMLEAMFR